MSGDEASRLHWFSFGALENLGKEVWELDAYQGSPAEGFYSTPQTAALTVVRITIQR